MLRTMSLPRLITSLLMVASVLILVSIAWGSFKKKDPQILEVFVISNQTEVLILGKNFPKNPQVSLGDQGLLNVHPGSMDTEIRADLPPGLEDGDYLLTVSNGKKFQKKSAEYDLTIGALGTSGPSGPSGETGPSGPSGSSGETGPSGPSGPSGETGPSGPSGSLGETGPSGPSGPMGVMGVDGMTGASGPTGPSGPMGNNLGFYRVRGNLTIMAGKIEGIIVVSCNPGDTAIAVTGFVANVPEISTASFSASGQESFNFLYLLETALENNVVFAVQILCADTTP